MRLSDALRPIQAETAIVIDSVTPEIVATSVVLLVVRDLDGLDRVVYDVAVSN